MAKRKPIPHLVRLSVLMEAGYKCGNPACHNIITLDLHHIEWVKDGGGNKHDNLLPLCGYCHDQHTAGHIPAEAIRHWKGMLQALNAAFDRGSADLLLYLWETQNDSVSYSTDAILRFSGLIAAGLVTFSGHQKPGTPVRDDVPHSVLIAVRLALTDKGKRLVEAWRSGSEGAHRQIIGDVDRNEDE